MGSQTFLTYETVVNFSSFVVAVGLVGWLVGWDE